MPAPKRLSRRTAFVLLMAVVVAIPLAALAADAFDDVPDSNVHHDDITWLRDAGVTLGCNPPANTDFCPGDPVLRQQMASFMRRLAENQVVDAGTLEGQSAEEIIAAAGGAGPATGGASSQVTDFNQSILVDTTDWVEILSVDADVAGDANVTLAAHVYVERNALENERYEVKLAAVTCDGDPLGVGWWRPDNSDGGFEATTIAVTGFGTVAEPTTFVLCAAKFSDAGPDITAHMRGITATWSPAPSS